MPERTDRTGAFEHPYDPPCDGSSECKALIHLHGCFSDKGHCDAPQEHSSGASGLVLQHDWEKLAHHFAEQLVEGWHKPDSAHALTLAEFMGLTEEQYAAWVECRYAEVLP